MQLRRKDTRSYLKYVTRHESRNRHKLLPGNGLQLILVQQKWCCTSKAVLEAIS